MPSNLPLVYRWDAAHPPPRLALRLSNRRAISVPPAPMWLETGSPARPFDFSAALHSLCDDMIRRTPLLEHIDLSRVLFSIVKARNGRGHGLQARVTPLRFRDGALTTLHRGVRYQVQRMLLNGREILYLVTFVLPRFMNREFEDCMVTIFHELYHLSP